LIQLAKNWWNKEEIENKALAKELGLPDLQPLSEDYDVAGFMIIDTRSGKSSKFPHEITIHKREPKKLEATPLKTQILVKINLTLKLILMVPQSLVKHGCHGRYSLKEARRLTKQCGGDPVCGGGIKYMFPPETATIKARKLLKSILSRPSFGCFINTNDRNDLEFLSSDYVYATAYIGSKSDIQSYFREHHFLSPFPSEFSIKIIN
jgi:hypothetical protein